MTSAAALTTLRSDPINNVCSVCGCVEVAPNVIKSQAGLASTGLTCELSRQAEAQTSPRPVF